MTKSKKALTDFADDYAIFSHCKQRKIRALVAKKIWTIFKTKSADSFRNYRFDIVNDKSKKNPTDFADDYAIFSHCKQRKIRALVAKKIWMIFKN